MSEERSGDRTHNSQLARPAVSVGHLSKSFRLPHQRYHTLKERVLHPRRARTFDVLHAVQDVTLDIAQGEFFGIVGRNGSGKSTLLKCLAGIYEIDAGSLEVNGRLSPFIELGVGFNPDLPARDNVIINAIMLGLTRKQARERFDDIIAFAGLEEFVDLKLKNYSSGMYIRLAFATAVQVDPDILLIDEVLAVGDAAFQQKCYDEFTRLQEAGRTVLFVTHDMGAVERYCDRVMLLERGHVVDIGDPASIARQYNRLNFQHEREAPPSEGSPASVPVAPDDDAVAQVVNAWFAAPDGQVIVTTNQGEPCDIRMQVRFLAEIVDPKFLIRLQADNGQFVFATNTDAQQLKTGRFGPDTIANIRIRFDNWLAPGRYRLVATVARAGFGADELATHLTSSIIVLAERPGGGIADLPSTMEIDRG